MSENNKRKRKQIQVTEDQLIPAVERFLEAYQSEVSVLEKMSKKVSDHDTIIRVGKNVLQLNELNEDIRSKIGTVKGLVKMFLKVKCDTEKLISDARNNSSGDSSEDESVPGMRNHDSNHDLSSEVELPDHLQHIDETAPVPMVPFSSGHGFTTSTPKNSRIGKAQNNRPGTNLMHKPSGVPLMAAAKRANRVPSSEISATQAARSLEALIVPSGSKPPPLKLIKPPREVSVVASVNSKPDLQFPPAPSNIKEPSRTEIIKVTYDHPPRKDIECPYCSVTFMSRQTLISHVRDKHSRYYNMYSKVNELYQSKSLLLQLNSAKLSETGCSKRSKECTICNMSFARDKLMDHLQDRHIFEINNFIWVTNFSDASHAWREFFMTLQGTDIAAEKERSAAYKKSILKPTCSTTPVKEAYDKLRTKTGIKRTKLPNLDDDVVAKKAKNRPQSRSSEDISRPLSRSDATSKQAKENLPRNPPKTPTKQSKKKKEPKTDRIEKSDPAIVDKDIPIQDVRINLHNVDVVDLDAEPEEYQEPIGTSKAGPRSKKMWVQCKKCEMKFLKPMGLAVHRIKWCKFRKPNPFRQSTLSQSFTDKSDNDRSGSSDNNRKQSKYSNFGPKPGPSRGGDSNAKPMEQGEPDLDNSMDIYENDEAVVADKNNGQSPSANHDQGDKFVLPDSTSSPISTRKTLIEVAPSTSESDYEPSILSSSDDDDDDDETSRVSKFYEDDFVKVDGLEQHALLVEECVFGNVAVEVSLLDPDMEDVDCERFKKLSAIFDQPEGEINLNRETGSEFRGQKSAKRGSKSSSFTHRSVKPIPVSPPRDPRLLPRDPRLVERNILPRIIQDTTVPSI